MPSNELPPVETNDPTPREWGKPVPVELNLANSERLRQQTERFEGVGAAVIEAASQATPEVSEQQETLITEVPAPATPRPDLRTVPELITEVPDHLKPGT